MNKFTILNLNLDTVDMFVNCFKANGVSTNPDYVKWLYINNDASKCIVDIAFDNKRQMVAGIYALTCLRFKIADKEVLGATSIDTITDKNYRKQGLFYQLAFDVYEKAFQQGLSIVHGFPNKNSVHGYRNKINYHMQDPIPFMIRPLNSRFITNKIAKWLPNIKIPLFHKIYTKEKFYIEEKKHFPKEINNIWKDFSKTIGVGIIRDKSFLDWRYGQKPNGQYRIAHCYDSQRKYLGCIVFLIRKNALGGFNSYIMDLIYSPDMPKVGKALLDYALFNISEEKADFVMSLCYNHSVIYNIFKSRLFIPMPSKLAPPDNHFGYKILDNSSKDFICNKNNWFLSYADSDTV